MMMMLHNMYFASRVMVHNGTSISLSRAVFDRTSHTLVVVGNIHILLIVCLTHQSQGVPLSNNNIPTIVSMDPIIPVGSDMKL